MKTYDATILVLALAVVTAAGAGNATAGVDAGVLTSHPLKTLDGGDASLASFKGDVMVVNFWASWCQPCRKELPLMNRWDADWKDRGARVVAISIDKEIRNAQRFASKAGLTMSLYHDGPDGIARKMDIPSLPCTFLIDTDGNVVSVTTSSSDSDLAALHGQVEKLLAQKPRRPERAGTHRTMRAGTASPAGTQLDEGGRP